MNRKLFTAALAGLAAIAVAGGGSTFAAWSDFGDIKNNSVGAGILKLNLNSKTGTTDAAPISWSNLAPGMTGQRMVWIASNDGKSVPDANLSMTVSDLQNQENGCSTNSERAADPTCASADDKGELSHILNIQSSYYPTLTSQTACAEYPGDGKYDAFWASAQGDLDAANGHTFPLYKPGTGPLTYPAVAGVPLVLKPGQGVCVGLSAYWPHDPSNQIAAESPNRNDNVAQGDSLSFDVRFTLSQV